MHLLSPGSADAIMVMGYDFNWSGSARAGAVAPMDSPYTLDLREAMAAYLARVPASRIIWGVPYYGRAWTTTSKPMNSQTCRSAGTCTAASWASTYVNARDAALTYGRRWDDVGKVPWYRYQSTTYDTWVQGYYDDPTSLTVKYEFVKASRVRGIGIWHLLMDGSRRELWNTIATEFGPPPFTDIAGSRYRDAITWVCPERDHGRLQCQPVLPQGLPDAAASWPAPWPTVSTCRPPTDDFYPDDDGQPARGRHQPPGGGRADPRLRRWQLLPRPGRPSRPAGQRSGLGPRTCRPPTDDFFTDDTGDRHEANINRIAAAGITSGCGDGRYCPEYRVSRAQAAAFLRNAFD